MHTYYKCTHKYRWCIQWAINTLSQSVCTQPNIYLHTLIYMNTQEKIHKCAGGASNEP